MGNNVTRAEYMTLQRLVDERIANYFSENGLDLAHIKEQIDAITQMDQQIRDITLTELAEQGLDRDSITTLIENEVDARIPPVFLGCTQWYDGTSGLIPAPPQHPTGEKLYLSSEGYWEPLPSK